MDTLGRTYAAVVFDWDPELPAGAGAGPDVHDEPRRHQHAARPDQPGPEREEGAAQPRGGLAGDGDEGEGRSSEAAGASLRRPRGLDHQPPSGMGAPVAIQTAARVAAAVAILRRVERFISVLRGSVFADTERGGGRLIHLCRRIFP